MQEVTLCDLRWQVERPQIDALHTLQKSSKLSRFCTIQQALQWPRQAPHRCDNMQVHIMATRRSEVPVISLIVATVCSRYMPSCLLNSLQIDMKLLFDNRSVPKCNPRVASGYDWQQTFPL